MSPGKPVEFCVLFEDDNRSESFTQPCVTLDAGTPAPAFFEDAMAALLDQSMGKLFASVRRGVHRYVGQGRIQSLDAHPLQQSYLIAAGISGILAGTEVNDSINLHWQSLSSLIASRLYLVENAPEYLSTFRQHFSNIAAQMANENLGTLSDLHGWSLEYPDGLKLSKSMPGQVNISHPKTLRKPASRYTLEPGQTPEGFIAAFESFLDMGAITHDYAVPIALRYDIDRKRVPESRLEEMLGFDLGL